MRQYSSADSRLCRGVNVKVQQPLRFTLKFKFQVTSLRLGPGPPGFNFGRGPTARGGHWQVKASWHVGPVMIGSSARLDGDTTSTAVVFLGLINGAQFIDPLPVAEARLGLKIHWSLQCHGEPERRPEWQS